MAHISIAGDIIKRYEDATTTLLQAESEEETTTRSGECVECGRFVYRLSANGYCEGCVMQAGMAAAIDAMEE